ncbi:hypothetical protein [Herbaspirillum rhizosphaerae]|uniref:hypothetical protein n=1 Tax=Herbaspirillum rhizosphaerae TaxID=346179 RepID=UPI000AF6B75E|nr:hypothetical protein [Herbaspirillum rhizosphaerae]
MNEEERNARNNARLQELYPTFRARIAKVINLMEQVNFRPRIQDAWRSPEDQIVTSGSTLRPIAHNSIHVLKLFP